MKSSKTFYTSLTDKEMTQFKRLAHARKQSMGDLVSQFIRGFLRRQEGKRDEYSLSQAVQDVNLNVTSTTRE